MSPAINRSALIGSWLHSHEEDTATTAVYRRADYDFPPARGRKGFELRPDGTLTENGIGPTDRPIQTAGRWQLGADACLKLFNPPADQPARVLAIETVDKERLTVRKDSQSCAASKRSSTGG